MLKSNRIRLLECIPTIGILLFVGLYFYATLLYPGGSQADVNAVGFDWTHNYWCNLMNVQAENGQPNPARPIAITGMMILCLGFIFFFIQFARKQAQSRFWKFIIRIFGVITMVLVMFIYTDYHDLLTTLSSIFGVFVVFGIIREIYKSKLTLFKITGLFCILLLALNNSMYYSEYMIEYLPLIQKFTFAFVLSWIMGLNYILATKKSV